MPVKVVESNLNVLQAAKIRIRNVFANGCKIYLSFSSGKDSLCMANLVYEMILSGELDPKQLTVTFIDEEGLYPSMVDAAYRWRRNFLSVGAKFLWFCLPFKQVSVIDHLSSSESWITWEPGKEDVWMRKPPDFAIMYSPYLHYAGEMNYQTFCSKAFSDGIQLVGLRTAESLTRFKCIANTKMERITRGGKFYPIYEQFFGKTVMPGSPERLFISWVEDAIMYERAQNNWTGCQNLPSSAEGEYLDGLAELFYLQERPKPTAATCTMRFYISEPRQTAVLIPAGTRVTDDNAALYWETSADEYVPIGATYTDVQVTCQTVGTAGNDYAVGDIHTAVDIYDYYSGCSNITVSANGSDAPDDEEFYELMRDSQSAWSDAGPIGAYKYFAKRVSTEIADVVANSPSPGTVCLYAVMNDGSVAGEETKRAMVAACSPDEIRPLTDYVISGDPEEVPYDIDLTYYLTRDGSISASEAQSGVNEAVQRYIRWQSGKMGRDINPDRLRYLLLSAGIKRVDLKQPAFTPLEDGAPSLDRNDKVPQVAKLGMVTIKSGGYEDE